MIKDFWINLPVKDVKKSTEFYTQLGFRTNSDHNNSENSTCLFVGEKNVVVMLYKIDSFQKLIDSNISQINIGVEVLLAIDAPSKEAVVEIACKVVKLGGRSGTSRLPWSVGCTVACLKTLMDTNGMFYIWTLKNDSHGIKNIF
jgi:hypothetical protein